MGRRLLAVNLVPSPPREVQPPAGRSPALRSKSKTLLVTPYLGEFGWELMSWHGRVRWAVARGDYERVVLCATADRRSLYDLSDSFGLFTSSSLSGASNASARVEFCPVDAFDAPGEADSDRRVDADGRPIAAATLRDVAESLASQACQRAGVDDVTDADVLAPDYLGRVYPTASTHQMFIELRADEPVTTDVLLVPRTRTHAAERNHPATWWGELAAMLARQGLRVETYRPPLDNAIRQLSRARLAIGASTGGMHLASLVRCPHYVWGSGREERWTDLGITNRQRYETFWNPFGTACVYDPCGWQPSLEHVTRWARTALDTIGLRPGLNRLPWTLRPKWRVKRRLARLLERDPRDSLFPWRLRVLVREHLV